MDSYLVIEAYAEKPEGECPEFLGHNKITLRSIFKDHIHNLLNPQKKKETEPEILELLDEKGNNNQEGHVNVHC